MVRYRDFDPTDPKWLTKSSGAHAANHSLPDKTSRWIDCRQVIVAYNLPPDISRLVFEVVQRTRLSHAAKLEIVRELCGQFTSELQNGTPPDELILAYGSPKQAASLIRRSKLRSQPFGQRFVRRFSQYLPLILLVLFTLGYGFLTLRYRTASASISHNYWDEINSARKCDPADRAWPLYRTALEEIGEEDGNLLWTRSSSEYSDLTKDPNWPGLVELLIRHAKSIQLARDAAQKPRLGYVLGDPEDRAAAIATASDWITNRNAELAADNRQLPNAWLSGFLSLRFVASAMSLDARRALDAGDSATAIADIEAILGLSKQVIQPHGTLIEQLVAVSIFGLALDTINSALANSPARLTEGDLQRIAKSLEAMCDAAFMLDFSGERMIFEDQLQRWFTDIGRGDGQLTHNAVENIEANSALLNPGEERIPSRLDAMLNPIRTAFAGSRRDNRELFNSLLDEIIASHQGAAWQWNRDGTRAVHDRLKTLSDSPSKRLSYFPVTLMLPAMQSMYNVAEQATQRCAATQAAIALVLWHRHHGEWPESLAVLVPSLLPAIPLDRFDGEPLRYRVVDGQPKLYSIGEDRKDDHGRPAASQFPYFDERPDQTSDQAKHSAEQGDGDWILWPAPATTPEKNAAPTEILFSKDPE